MVLIYRVGLEFESIDYNPDNLISDYFRIVMDNH